MPEGQIHTVCKRYLPLSRQRKAAIVGAVPAAPPRRTAILVMALLTLRRRITQGDGSEGSRRVHPSTSAADASAVQNKPTGVLELRSQNLQDRVPADNGRGTPCSFGQAQSSAPLAVARVARDPNAPAQEPPGSGAALPANSPMSSELADLMQAPAGGGNHGRRLSDNPNVEGRHLPLETERWQRGEFMRSNGWVVVNPERAHHGTNAGAVSHVANQYTVLHPDDHVDEALLAALVEDELGFTLEQLHSVYSTGGRIPSARHALRDALDARLLDLSRGGANMDLFGRITGLNGSTVDRALARARAKEGK